MQQYEEDVLEEEDTVKTGELEEEVLRFFLSEHLLLMQSILQQLLLTQELKKVWSSLLFW